MSPNNRNKLDKALKPDEPVIFSYNTVLQKHMCTSHFSELMSKIATATDPVLQLLANSVPLRHNNNNLYHYSYYSISTIANWILEEFDVAIK